MDITISSLLRVGHWQIAVLNVYDENYVSHKYPDFFNSLCSKINRRLHDQFWGDVFFCICWGGVGGIAFRMSQGNNRLLKAV